LRAVLLGASNVNFSLRYWVARLRGAAGGPVEALAACGNGRSYGTWSRFLFTRRLPGIVECGIWEALAARPPLPTVALVADIGNDILYEHPVETIAAWADTCLDRLAATGARSALALSSLPVIESVGRLRYFALRTFFYPGRTLPFAPAKERARQVDHRLRELAAARSVPLVDPDPLWYASDPIHLRPHAWPAACDATLVAWGLPCNPPDPPGRPVHRRGLPGMPFAEERLLGRRIRTNQPALAYADGTTLSFY
jgi:hypothetical protein